MVEGPVGFVNGRTPEEVSEADTVADDVEGSVPEGTFVINASAVEEYGSERIRKLLVSALQEAERQGIDISASDSTIVDEDSVSVAVSEGEVLIPPVLVRIIGLKKLKQINSLGQEEVAERVEEYGQAEASEPVEGEAQVMASVGGGFIERQRKAPGGEVSDEEFNILVERANRMFKNPGRNFQKNPDFDFGELKDILDRLFQRKEGIHSETDVSLGSTEPQRDVSKVAGLTPAEAQQLWLNFPTIRKIVLSESGNKELDQRVESLNNAENILKQQVGANFPQQNSALSVDDVYGSDTSLNFLDVLDQTTNEPRVLSETEVGGSSRGRSRSRSRHSFE
jgi:hypothetical protein